MSPTRSSSSAPDPAHVPVVFLVFCIDTADGVSRAVLTLADELARTHPVEVVSLYRRRAGRAFPVSDRVQVSYLLHRPLPRRDDPSTSGAPAPAPVPAPASARPARTPRVLLVDRLARRTSRLAHGRGFPHLNLLTDLVLARRVRAIRSGVLVTTRPALHVVAARLARRGVVTIGQDHLNFVSRAEERGSLGFIEEAARHGLDAFVALTPTDAADYGAMLTGTRTRVSAIGNPLAWPVLTPAQAAAGRGGPGARVVVAAGRLVRRKGMARLVTAFAPVARRHPDWELHVHGTGALRPVVQRRIDRLGLGGQVRLLGWTGDLAGAFARADVFAAASRAEGFPMVMLEAMSTGLPLVAMDCPRGPADIVRHGGNGLLVPADDVRGLSAALEQVVADDDLRARMSAQALQDAEAYAVDRVAAQWEQLFATLVAERSAGKGRPTREREVSRAAPVTAVVVPGRAPGRALGRLGGRAGGRRAVGAPGRRPRRA